MTYQEFTKIALYLAAAIGKPMNDKTVEVYFDALKDLPADVVQLAARRAIQESMYPVIPLIGVLRKLASEVSIGQASNWSEEWATVVRAISRYGIYRKSEAMDSFSPMTREVVKALGWDALCDIHTAERSIIAGQFRMAYEARTSRDAGHAALSADVRPRITGAGHLRVIGDLAGKFAISDEDAKAS